MATTVDAYRWWACGTCADAGTRAPHTAIIGVARTARCVTAPGSVAGGCRGVDVTADRSGRQGAAGDQARLARARRTAASMWPHCL